MLEEPACWGRIYPTCAVLSDSVFDLPPLPPPSVPPPTSFRPCSLPGDRVALFLLKPTNTHAFEGESFTLSCRGDQFTIAYVWLKDGAEFHNSSRVRLEEGGEGSTVVVGGATKADSGIYTCVILSEDGQNRASAIVNVTGPLLTCDGKLLGWYNLGKFVAVTKK